MTWTPRQSRRTSGMTLLELLVATAIFAALISALYGALSSGMRLRETAWENFEAGVARGQVARIIGQDLTNIVVPSGALAGPLLGETKSSGDDRFDTVEFCSTTGAVTGKEPWGEIQKIEYFLEEPLRADGKTGNPTDAGYDFVRRATRNLLATVIEEEDVPEAKWRLLTGVRSLTIQYYDGQSWADSWDTTTVESENPAGISLRFDFEPDAERRARAPLEVICEIAQQPRATPIPAAPVGAPAGGGGGGATP